MAQNPRPRITPADKKRIDLAYKRAQQFQGANRLDEALSAYAQLVKHYPFVAEAHFQIARILSARSHFVDARAACEAALNLRPREEAIWVVLVDITRAEGRQKPGAILARARKAGLSADAVARLKARFEKPSEYGSMPTIPKDAEPMVKRADEAAQNGDDAAALKYLKRALVKSPDAAAILIRLAHTYMTLGDLDAAAEAGQKAIKAAPNSGYAWGAWSRPKKISANDANITELKTRYEATPKGTDDRRLMAYALAKVMEDTRADGELFKYLNEANDLTAQRFPYGFDADQKVAASVQKAFASQKLKALGDKGNDRIAPIFITGLPRSGTTLIEQIISSHPQVSAGGEMSLINGPIASLVADIATEKTDCDKTFADVGHAYADQVHQLHPNREMVTDKSISTYVHLGFIPLALPRAKIIVVRRDPRDSCLALLRQRFNDGDHRYTYSMEWVAQFYKLFANQIAFWRKMAPDAFIEVRYEDIIADQEGQTRRMLEYCELSWDEACLNFHENTRSVKTLSTAQVRQPLYSSSVGSWKRYEKDLKPLISALGPLEDLS